GKSRHGEPSRARCRSPGDYRTPDSSATSRRFSTRSNCWTCTCGSTLTLGTLSRAPLVAMTARRSTDMAKKKQITSKKSKHKQAIGHATGESRPAATVAPSRSSATPPAPRTPLIELLSDTTFVPGERTAGVVDVESEPDAYGMPYIGGKSIRGLLRDSWLSMEAHFAELREAAARVLGHSQAFDDVCRLRVSDAALPRDLRDVVRQAVERTESPISPSAMLEAFTTVRH